LAASTIEAAGLDHLGGIHPQKQLVLDDQHHGPFGGRRTRSRKLPAMGNKRRIPFSFRTLAAHSARRQPRKIPGDRRAFSFRPPA
jgi:hypothetical protein